MANVSFYGNPQTLINRFVGLEPPQNPLFLSSTVGMQVGDIVEIMLDNNELFRTTITNILKAGEILIANGLPYRASAGNIVINLTQSKNVPPLNTEDFS